MQTLYIVWRLVQTMWYVWVYMHYCVSLAYLLLLWSHSHVSIHRYQLLWSHSHVSIHRYQLLWSRSRVSIHSYMPSLDFIPASFVLFRYIISSFVSHSISPYIRTSVFLSAEFHSHFSIHRFLHGDLQTITHIYYVLTMYIVYTCTCTCTYIHCTCILQYYVARQRLNIHVHTCTSVYTFMYMHSVCTMMTQPI